MSEMARNEGSKAPVARGQGDGEGEVQGAEWWRKHAVLNGGPASVTLLSGLVTLLHLRYY